MRTLLFVYLVHEGTRKTQAVDASGVVANGVLLSTLAPIIPHCSMLQSVMKAAIIEFIGCHRDVPTHGQRVDVFADEVSWAITLFVAFGSVSVCSS